MKQYVVELKKALVNLGVKQGDIIYIASDITLLLNNVRKKYEIKTVKDRNIFLNEVVDTLKELISYEGTILFPMFTWEFCRKKTFDIKNTKSEVGALNNWILQNRADFLRTAHPIYSFMVWGKDAEKLLRMNNVDSWGSDSPFEYFYKEHAKMLLLDVHLKQCFTFMHYVEESIRVPYRYLKNFRSQYINDNGVEEERSYTMFVRDLDIDSEPFEPDEFLLEPGVMIEDKWLEIPLRCVDLYKSYDVYKNDFLFNKGKNCYKFINYELNWDVKQTHSDDLNN